MNAWKEDYKTKKTVCGGVVCAVVCKIVRVEWRVAWRVVCETVCAVCGVGGVVWCVCSGLAQYDHKSRLDQKVTACMMPIFRESDPGMGMLLLPRLLPFIPPESNGRVDPFLGFVGSYSGP